MALNPLDPIYISCGIQRLYDEGNFPGSESERLSIDSEQVAGKFICDLFPSYRYHRPIEPDHLYCGDEFRQTLIRARDLINVGPTGSSSALFLLPRVIIRDRVIYLDDGATYPIVYETHRPIDRANSSLASLDELRGVEIDTGESGPTLFLGSTGCFNYGHWLVDDLSRLKSFWEIRKLHPDEVITIVLTAHSGLIDIVRTESIEVLLSNDNKFKIRLIPRPTPVSFKSIYYASPTTVHSTLKSPEAMEDLRTAAIKSISSSKFSSFYPNIFGKALNHRLLFIDRGPSRSRYLRNGDEIFSALQAFGFEHYTLEETSFSEQVKIFSEAKIVVGNMVITHPLARRRFH